MTLEGKVAIITGASRGIGADIARHLGGLGVAVAVAARSEEEPDPRLPGTIHSVVQEIEDAGGRALAVRTNVRYIEDTQALVDATVAEFGRLDILVNNAGITFQGSVEEIPLERLELIWQIDLRAPIVLCRQAIPHMRASGGGHIINVSSNAARPIGAAPYERPRTGSFIYSAFKAGLNRFNEQLARDLQYDGSRISCNVLSPMGRLKTPGNLYAGRDYGDPLDFEVAEAMAKATAWICEQPPEFSGHVLWDQELCDAQGL